MLSKIVELILLSGGLYGLEKLLPGISIPGEMYYFVIGGAVLLILYELVKPILKLITFPINLITFGLFGSVMMVVLIYLIAQVSGFVVYDSKTSLIIFSIILGFYSTIVSKTL